MEKTLVLTFRTEDKKTYRVNINKPKEALAKELIQALADKIIAGKILNNSKRVLKTFEKAVYVSRKEDKLV